MPWMPSLPVSGCGAAWLARLLGVQEVPSSNLGSPTKLLKDIWTLLPLHSGFWSPSGVQNGRRGGHVRAPAVPTVFRSPNSLELSTPRKTRRNRSPSPSRFIKTLDIWRVIAYRRVDECEG